MTKVYVIMKWVNDKYILEGNGFCSMRLASDYCFHKKPMHIYVPVTVNIDCSP